MTKTDSVGIYHQKHFKSILMIGFACNRHMRQPDILVILPLRQALYLQPVFRESFKCFKKLSCRHNRQLGFVIPISIFQTHPYIKNSHSVFNFNVVFIQKSRNTKQRKLCFFYSVYFGVNRVVE